MKKITDQDYFLPVIHALTGHNLFTNGTTTPMLIRGVCTKTAEKSDYVIKFRNSPRMSVEASCRELIAAFIAKELGLHIADPVLIDVSPEFAETLTGREGFKIANNSIGLNSGCLYFRGYREFLKGEQLNKNQFIQAEKIFAFDVLISNVDRRVDKQNILTDGNEILIFDHELAFGFVMDIIKNPTPWIINQGDITWIKNHYFFKLLKQDQCNFDTFIENISVLDANFWNILGGLLPKMWVTPQVHEIQTNLGLLVKNRKYFLEQLYILLS